jgi:hypothetical protein
VTHDLPKTAAISSGGRVDFRLDSARDNQVTYEARWFIGDDTPILGRVLLNRTETKAEAGGPPSRVSWTVEITSHTPLPEWLDQFTANLLRTLARGTPPWPRRITRWRDER